jgi:hypothetical protein
MKSKKSKYDTVTLLFIDKLKKVLKIVIPDFDEDVYDPFYCYKYAKSIIP